MMKAGCLCALLLLSLHHCQAVGYGSHLLSLITGKQPSLPTNEAIDPALVEEKKEEEEINEEEECLKFQIFGIISVFWNCNGTQATL